MSKDPLSIDETKLFASLLIGQQANSISLVLLRFINKSLSSLVHRAKFNASHNVLQYKRPFLVASSNLLVFCFFFFCLFKSASHSPRFNFFFNDLLHLRQIISWNLHFDCTGKHGAPNEKWRKPKNETKHFFPFNFAYGKWR